MQAVLYDTLVVVDWLQPFTTKIRLFLFRPQAVLPSYRISPVAVICHWGLHNTFIVIG